MHTKEIHKEFINSRKTVQKKQKSRQNKKSTNKESKRKKFNKEKIQSIIFFFDLVQYIVVFKSGEIIITPCITIQILI